MQRVAEALCKGLYFPEGARWMGDRLWFAEIQVGRVSSIDMTGDRTIEATLGTPCSGLGFLPSGTPVVSLMRDQRIIRIENGAAKLHADLTPLGFDHINDIVTDSEGRIYVDALRYHMRWDLPDVVEDGIAFYGFENQAASAPASVTDSLVLVDRDSSIKVLRSDLLGPNGLALSVDGSMLVVAEWRADRLRTFGVECIPSERGEVLAEVPSPDGICTDLENAVWVASPVLGECIRISQSGEVVGRVKPSFGRRVTACALGGPDLRMLFLTTDRHPERASGAIEVAAVECPGVGPV
jgi:sugar lactone lactonase YvrE